MGISDIQHRSMVGMNNRSRGVSMFYSRYQSRFLYRFKDLTKTLLDLMINSSYDYSHLNGYYYVPILFILYCLVICMITCLSMQIDISIFPDIITTRSTKIHLGPIHSNTYGDILFSGIINWTVLMLYFSRPNITGHSIFYQCYKLAKYSPKATKLKKIENSLLYYIAVLNLVLIVIVTPSIVNPGPTNQTKLKIGYCNVQGLIFSASMRGNMPIFQTNKLIDIQSYVYTNDLDLVIINESWLNSYINNNELFNEDHYKMFRLDRSEKDKIKYNKVGGGGLFLLVKESLNVESRIVSIATDAPILSIELKFPDSSKVCLSTFYRYGYSSLDMFEDAKKYYETLCAKYSKIHLIGDLNLSTISDWHNPTTSCTVEQKFIKLFQNLGLVPKIFAPTHRDGKTLDQLLTSEQHLISDVQILPNEICHSDHFTVLFNLKIRVPRKKAHRVRIFNYKKANWAAINAELRLINWKVLFGKYNVLACWNSFKSKLDICMRKHIPMINVKFKQQPPWFDSEIHELCKLKDKYRRKAKTTNNTLDQEAYRNSRKELKAKIEAKKREYISGDTFDNDDLISKRFWSYVKSNTNSPRIPESVHYQGKFRSDVGDKCELYNKYFCDQFSQKSSYMYNLEQNFINNDTYWIKSFQVKGFLRQIKPNKAPGPDGISGHILKHCSETLSFPLSILFNKSYRTGNIPDDWKNANVVPIHKKGPKNDVTNYRPVSLTSLVMKVFEKCIRDKIYNLCKDKITPNQHGFLPNRSCTTQLVPFVNSLSFTLNCKGQSDIIYFDFAKAFDSENHDIILEKLQNIFDINGLLLNFIKNYLMGRKQRVIIQNQFSSYADVRSGVPQGSILGPLLFVLFINDLCDVLNPGTGIYMYADDTKIWREIDSEHDQKLLQTDINELYNWSLRNKIRFHPDKCKVISVSLKHKPCNFAYNMNGHFLEKVEHERDLGVIVSKNLKWNKHQNYILNKSRQKLGLLKRICSFSQNSQHRKQLFLSIVRSQFEHCSPVWRPNKPTQMKKFESVQKRGIKWILNEDYKFYTKSEYHDKLKKLDILPINLKFIYNDITLFHNIVFGNSSIQLPDYYISREDGYMNADTTGRYFQRNTRNNMSFDHLMFKCKITPKVDAFRDNFFHRTVCFWNNLPLAIREIKPRECFKIKLKEHLWIIADEELGVG